MKLYIPRPKWQKSSKVSTCKMIFMERLCLLLIVPANFLYCLAALTHSWFELQGHGTSGVFYGLWWVEFCDHLRCQLIPAFFSDEPVWYHVLQILSLFAWAGLTLSLVMLVNTDKLSHMPWSGYLRRPQAISAVSIASVFAISTSLVIFYCKLGESSPSASPLVHWSAVLAGMAGLLEMMAGLILLKI